VKAHPCIGGPLDGLYATDGDFHGSYEKVPGTKRNDYGKPVEGMYEHLKGEYTPYNIATRAMIRGKERANVVYVHDSLNRASVSPRLR
jgi:hypothetical protein